MTVAEQLFRNHYDPKGLTGEFSLQYNLVDKLYDKNGIRVFRRITLSNHWKRAYQDSSYVINSSIPMEMIGEGEIIFYGNES